MNAKGIALAYLYLRNQERRANYEEWCDRVSGNIRRWEESLSKIEAAISRVDGNNRLNAEKLRKAERYLDSLNSGKTLDWYNRTLHFISVSKSADRVIEAQVKIDEYNKKKVNAESMVSRYAKWISDGNRSLYEMRTKVRDLSDKISSAYSKLND